MSNHTAQIPIINDPFVGEVYGNILDMYDNPSYNLKLFMVRKEYQDKFKETAEFFNSDKQVAPPADTVVLAQTGVTANQIDNVVIQSLATPGKAAQLTVDFTIVQPGAATFLDEIQYAKGYLGLEGAETILFLEIRFQGYETDYENNDEGGAPVTIVGPLVYKLKFTNFSVTLDASGSQYECQTQINATSAYRDAIFRTPQTLTTTGATISEHVADFETALNEWHTETTAHTVPDEIVIDLSKLINPAASNSDTANVIVDENLLTSADAGQTESVNRVMNETWEIRTKVEQQAALNDAPIDTGNAPEIIFDGDNLKVKEGTTIEEYMYILLSMCPEFYSKVSRKENIDDPESPVKKDQGFITWFKIHGSVEDLTFDYSRNKYAKKYTYTPILFRTANPNIALDVEEINPEIADIKTRVKQYIANESLKKAYSYIFTGLNDQILNLDISYDAGVSSMLVPKYGAIGEISQTSQNKVADSTPEGEDTSFESRLNNQLGKAKDKATKDIFGDFVDAVNDLQSGGDAILGSVASQLSNASGLSESQILTAIQTKTGINSLVEGLERDVRQQLSNLNVGTAPPPVEPPDVIPPANSVGPYTPEPSGYVYSADFIVPDTTQELDAATLAELGYVTVNDFKQPAQQAEAAKDVKSEAEAGTTQVRTTRNKLFGFITEQHEGNIFLIQLDLELRGDPWYLSPADLSRTSNANINTQGDENLFFLRIGSPQRYDPDYRDEDANTGYWKFDGTSRSFTGVYRMTSIVNNFSGGIFTTQIVGQKVGSLDEPLDEVATAGNTP